ncbi:MAG: hypothetical protein AAGC60_24425 [Acidobacteriota bacterium]
MNRRKNSPMPLAVVVFVTCLLSLGAASIAAALDLEATAEGYLVRLAPGESVTDAWSAIESARSQHGGAMGRDVIELGEGSHRLLDARGNPLLHDWSNPSDPPTPPLVIRGAGAERTVLHCGTTSIDYACASSGYGLTIEDVDLRIDNPRRGYLVTVSNADLVLRRVVLRGQTLRLEQHQGAISMHNGSLTIEDSLLIGNTVDGGEALVSHGSHTHHRLRIVRSILADNHGPALLDLYGDAEIEQSTVVDNHTALVVRGLNSERVEVRRSILHSTPSASVAFAESDSFTGASPQLAPDGFGRLVPRPGSPVVDGLACDGHPTDLRGAATGVRAVYLGDRGTDCDYGAIEARHDFCQATRSGTVACDEGSIDLTEVAALGCRLVAGLLDCSGGREIEIAGLGYGESVAAGSAQLILQADGDLALSDDGVAWWSTGTGAGACIGHAAGLVGGDFVVTSDPQPCGAMTCWSAGTAGQRLLLREGYVGDVAQLLVENADGSVGWITDHTPITSGRSFAVHGSRFRSGDQLTIPGARVVLEGDGDFVLYDTVDGVETVVWSLGTGGSCAGQDASFGADGNLVVGAVGDACLGALNPPAAGGVVLRLQRAASGGAVLALYDATGGVVWSAPEHPGPRRCADLPAGSADGVYTVFDRGGVAREVHCDLSGGGWMLVGKVYITHTGTSTLPEPSTWWTAGTGQATALVPGTVEYVTGPVAVSYGASWLAELDLENSRFDLVAEHAAQFTDIVQAVAGHTASWFKDPATVATWFSPHDTPSTVCSASALDCGVVGRIVDTGDGTWLEGMRLPMGGGWIHMRLEGDRWSYFDGVCSYTGDHPAWLDSAAGHWGNGLDVWVR